MSRGDGWRALAAMLACGLLAGACAGSEPSMAPSPVPTADAVRLASFDFPESRLLAELYGQALDAAGFPVAPVRELGSREIVEPALEQGHIDLVPEYTGSALNFLEGRADAADADEEATYERVARAFAERDLVVGAAAPAQNQNAFAVRRSTAEELGVGSLTELARVSSDLVLGGPPECPQRPTCLPGLEQRYGLEFERFLSISRAGHVAAALDRGEIDVGLLFTTDPAIVTNDFVVLADDRGLQPAENVVPVVRDDVVEDHGERLVATLDRVSALLTTEELAALNQAVQDGEEAVPAVARQWLAARDVTP